MKEGESEYVMVKVHDWDHVFLDGLVKESISTNIHQFSGSKMAFKKDPFIGTLIGELRTLHTIANEVWRSTGLEDSWLDLLQWLSLEHDHLKSLWSLTMVFADASAMSDAWYELSLIWDSLGLRLRIVSLP